MRSALVESRREPRWPASLAVLVGAAIYMGLPEAFTLGPTYLAPVVVAVPLVVLTSYSRYRAEDEARWLRLAAIGLILVVAIGNLLTLALLVDGLLQGPVLDRPAVTGLPVLRAALVVWIENVIALGLCYCELGRGGPHLRGTGRGGRARSARATRGQAPAHPALPLHGPAATCPPGLWRALRWVPAGRGRPSRRSLNLCSRPFKNWRNKPRLRLKWRG